MKTQRKRIIRKEYILLLIVVLIFLLVFEIFLRVLGYPVYGFSEGTFVKDENRGYKLTSNYSGKQSIFGRTVNVRTNSMGMRDYREYSYEKNIKRILIIGDSFSFGNGVNIEESYPEFLRESFKAEYEIINLGVPGYDAHNELATFMKEGSKYNPDIVLIQFALNDWGVDDFVEFNNEIRVKDGTTFCVDKRGYLVSCGEETTRKIHLFLLRNVRAYSFFYGKLRQVISSVLSGGGKEVPLYFHQRNEPEYIEAYESYLKILKTIKDNSNAEVILFIGPFKEDFVSNLEIKKEYNLNYFVDTSQIKEDLEGIARGLDIKVIRVDFDKPEFIKIDGHWTPKGNSIVANELYLKIKEKVTT